MTAPNFFAELKQRNVYKVAIAYAVVAWLLMQVASQIFPFFEIPNWAVRLVVLLLVIGFPIAVILAWAFDLTPEGIKRAEDVGPSKSIALKSRNLTALGGGAQNGAAPFATTYWSIVLEHKVEHPQRKRRWIDFAAPIGGRSMVSCGGGHRAGRGERFHSRFFCSAFGTPRPAYCAERERTLAFLSAHIAQTFSGE